MNLLKFIESQTKHDSDYLPWIIMQDSDGSLKVYSVESDGIQESSYDEFEKDIKDNGYKY